VKRIRFDTADMRMDRVEQLCEWVRSLGVEPNDLRSAGAIFMGKKSYELHLSQVVRGDDGKVVVNHAEDDVVSTPLVVDLGTEKSWPSWLGE
jgi:hypothetical protein